MLLENTQLKESSNALQQQHAISSSSQEFSSLGPQVFVKNLVRKLGGDSQHSAQHAAAPAAAVHEPTGDDKNKAGNGRYVS